MLSEIRPAIVSTILFTLLLGLGYPLAITGISQVAFPYQAGGSLVTDKAGHVVGSVLIAQAFAKDEYLHPRPSAAGNGYDPTSSGGSNLGPMDPKLATRMATDAATYRKDNPTATIIPADALTTSGSGLDPDVSPANAQMQAARIAAHRGVSAAQVQAIVDANTDQPVLGFLGEPSVNVLAVNLALDAKYPVAQPRGR
jgi:K+-transporting ATPase ATPase C chain